MVFNFTRTPVTEFVILIYLRTYVRDDDLVQVETYKKGIKWQKIVYYCLVKLLH